MLPTAGVEIAGAIIGGLLALAFFGSIWLAVSKGVDSFADWSEKFNKDRP